MAPPKPYTKGNAESLIRQLAQNGLVEFGRHARDAAVADGFTLPTLMKGLKSARIRGKGCRELENGEYSYRVYGRADGRQFAAGVKFTKKGSRAVVLTVFEVG